MSAKKGHKFFPPDPNPNSAQIFMDAKGKLHECGESMLNGAAVDSIHTSMQLVSIACRLHAVIVAEYEASIAAERVRRESSEARKAA